MTDPAVLIVRFVVGVVFTLALHVGLTSLIRRPLGIPLAIALGIFAGLLVTAAIR
jgi:hypothetical protein